MILFEWLLAQRLGVELPRLARQVVALLLYLVTATAVLKVILDIEYECRLWTARPWQVNDLRSEYLTRAWAALDRVGMEIPFPQRTVQFAAPAQAVDTVAQRAGAIATTKVFSGLPGEAVDRLAGRSRRLRFAPGEAIVREGEASRALYVIADGEAVVTAAGREIGRLAAGEVFGEMAFLTGEPRRATVRAQGSLAVVEVDSAALTALLEEHRELADELAHRMASRRLEDHPDERPAEPSQRGGLVGLLRDRLLRLVGGGSE
jgi:hypothetical protein